MTLISMFEQSVQKYGNKPALAHKPKDGTYQDMSYTEFGESVDAFSKGLKVWKLVVWELTLISMFEQKEDRSSHSIRKSTRVGNLGLRYP